MEELKFYCVKCGTELKYTLVYNYYNILTGKKEYLLEWKCPKHKFYNNHTKLITDSKGKKMCVV